jgi:predicted component of type VI protein secretion system
VHPESLYRTLVSLAGELATFTDPGKRAAAYPTYRHDQLAETFAPVIADLRRALSTVMDPQAVPIRSTSASSASGWRWCRTANCCARPPSCWR